MELVSLTFVLFLAAVCAVGYLVPRRFRYVALLAASYLFYLYSPGDWYKNLSALWLLLCSTLVSYLCAAVIGRAKRRSIKRIALVFSLTVCLGLLFACKYFNFFFSVLGDTAPTLNLVLPLGISYYTLQTVSYAADVYLEKQPAETNLLRYALYVSFFPGIVTGPINRASDMLPQYKNPPRFDYNRVAGGLFRVLWGIFKKMVIADNIAIFTASVFGKPAGYDGPVLFLAALLFAYQLYMDFGGCCDIAIGAARMLGFTFMENFERPFAAKTFSSLWQRWHISLTSFFRDYVFQPLVWSRWTEKLPLLGRFFKKPPVASSVIIIFALSGLWHGAALGYALWGLLNGAIMVLAQAFSKPKERLVKKIPLYRSKHVRGFFQRVFVYLLFAFCLVFFAAALYNSSAATWLSGIGRGWSLVSSGRLLAVLGKVGLTGNTLLVLLGSTLLVEGVERFAVVRGKSTVADWVRRRLWLWRWPLYYLLLAALLAFGAFGQSSFIYQNY